MNRYYNPVHTIEGPGCLAELPALLRRLLPGGGRVLVLAWSREALGHPVLANLAAACAPVEVESLVFAASNPTVEQLHAAWRRTKAHAPDVVVAVGGGSILDVGKSLCCLYGAELADVDALRARIAAGDLQPAARWIGVPTTAGTGSEVTCWATIWDPEQDTKRSLENHDNYAAVRWWTRSWQPACRCGWRCPRRWMRWPTRWRATGPATPTPSPAHWRWKPSAP